MSTSKRFTPSDAAAAIKWPLETWPGNCFAIASAIVAAGLTPGGLAVYGHWTGPVHERSTFYRSHRALGIARHGWIRMPDGSVIDPTRYEFEQVAPYIFEGEPPVECLDYEEGDDEGVCIHCDHVLDEHQFGTFFRPCLICRWPYDEGGNGLRDALQQPFPEMKAGDKVEEIDWRDETAIAVVTTLTDRDPHDHRVWSREQVCWIANISPRRLGDAAAAIYRALEATGNAVLIPIDNYDMVLGKTRPRKKKA